MMKVLANGDIVPDDDPRAGGRSNVSSDGERNRPRQVPCYSYITVLSFARGRHLNIFTLALYFGTTGD